MTEEKKKPEEDEVTDEQPPPKNDKPSIEDILKKRDLPHGCF